MLYQQGDILIRSVDKIPDSAKQTKIRPVILAEGETTGHTHSVLDEVQAFVDSQITYIKADKPFKIVHQEHNLVEIPGGLWSVSKVKEYDHFQEEARNVQD